MLRGIVADKPDAELFSIETSGADVSIADRNFDEESQKYKRIWKPLKCEANLINQSKINAIVTKKTKSLKNRTKGKARVLLRKNNTKRHGDSINNSSTISDSQHSQQQYNLWSTGEIDM